MESVKTGLLWGRIQVVFLVLPLVIPASCGEPSPYVIEMPPLPETKVEEVEEVLHGIEIVDPYRWLEDQESEETRAWIASQNAYTDAIMNQLPGEERLRQTFSEMLKVDEITLPFERGGKYFYSKRSADQDLYVTCIRDGLDGEEKVLLDPHPLSEDHTVTLNLLAVTDDGKIAAYSVRRGGIDEITIKLLNVDTGEELPDSFGEARYGSFVFARNGVYYGRWEQELGGARLYYRDLGSSEDQEELVFGSGVEKDRSQGCSLWEDRRWLLIFQTNEFHKIDLFIKDLSTDSEIIPVVQGKDAVFAGSILGDRLYIKTDWEAPNGRLLVTDLSNPGIENWRELIPEREDAVLQLVTGVGGKLFAKYLENAQTRIVVFDVEGHELGDISFEAIGTVGAMVGRWESDEAFFNFSAFHIPPTIYRYSVSTGEMEVWAKSEVPIDSDKYELKQLMYESRDGTQVPMFVVHKKGIELDGQNPVYMTGYGGFGGSITSIFSSEFASWIKLGVVFAIPCLRGGGEFGEEWHRAGMLENKQNVFDDFIAAAEYLIEQKYTRPGKIAIRGGSNGGLLVGAAMIQRPDLYGAVVCTYPLLDMLRYHKFMMGRVWMSEYGSADDPGQFEYLYKYSPYHNVKSGEEYPAVLFMTGDADTRVAPLHARKMAALMQASTGSDKPVMLRYHTKAGHSGGQPLSERIEENAEIAVFILWRLGVNLE